MSKLTTKTKNTPELRFPGFSSEWEEKMLGEICKIQTGNKDTQDRIENGKYPFYVRSNTVEKINSFSFDGEAILTSGDGVGVGKNFHYIVGKFDYHQRVYSLNSFDKGYNGKFIYNIFSTRFYKRVKGLSAKNSVDSVRMDMISNMRMYFPTLPEQQKIVGFLGVVDEWIGNLRKQKESFESYKKGMMRKIFSQEVRFKDDNGKDFPEWEEKKLGELGKAFSGLASKGAEDFGQGEPFITYKQIFDSSEINTQKFSLVKIQVNERQNKVQFGDILFTTSSETPLEVGFASVLLSKNFTPYLNSFSFGIRPNSFDILFPDFSKFFFRNQLFRKEVVKLAQGSTRYNISKVEFMKIKITLPTLPEQQKIAEFLTLLDKRIESKEQQITKAEIWKKGLLQKMFV
ncbi:MAG: type I restriction endonuclease subunit S [Parcubacteria group bacterium CG11_big_fil_rev_8_21_14_0_20_39_22]|nr:MAG: type I restriction endonuclease subunit S [Parcubacteria group bacterium CG11_big_fil_rev_8_21_14_0_20_39_22]